ncbi:MAG: cytochrome c [Thermoanaerobaculia bacterium]
MSQPTESSEPSRGAQRRRTLHERRLRTNARRWLTQPGLLIFLGIVILAGVGWGLVFQAAHRMPVRQATFDDLEMRLEDATWVEDQMEHGKNFQKPASMMPDLPGPGMQRVTLHMALHNLSRQPREFRGEELYLVPEIGKDVPPVAAVVGEATLEPGQTLNTALHFDLNTAKPHGKLLVKWQRGYRTAYFPIPEAPDHAHLRPRGGEPLPTDARLLLPIADAARGAQLYEQTYACSACHGDPHVPGSNNIGPHLGGIGVVAASRIKGKPAEQYIYESILQPDAFIAPECKNGAPCQSPSAMPEYSTLINLQDAADLLAYLLEQKAPPPAARAAASPAAAASSATRR